MKLHFYLFLRSPCLTTLSHILSYVVVAWILLFVNLFFGLRPTFTLKISCLGRAIPAFSIFQVRLFSFVPSIILSNQEAMGDTHRPALSTSPPSSTGISRLSPAPDAAEPTLMVLPGNFVVTDSSTPDSIAPKRQFVECFSGARILPESDTFRPCFASLEFSERSACCAIEIGS